jgi:hypothetical protein
MVRTKKKEGKEERGGKKGVLEINDGQTKMLPCLWETPKQGGLLEASHVQNH